MVLTSHVSLLNYKLKKRGVIASLFFVWSCSEQLFISSRTALQLEQLFTQVAGQQVSTTPILPRTIVHFWTNSRLTSPILQLPNNCTVQQPRLHPDPAPDPEQFNPITTRIQEKARTIPRAFAYHV